jgi:hypothetical protein
VICCFVTPYILVHCLTSLLKKAVHVVASREAIGEALQTIPISCYMTLREGVIRTGLCEGRSAFIFKGQKVTFEDENINCVLLLE